MILDTQTWVFVSEIVRNLGLAVAAFGGFYLAWRKLTPDMKQAESAAAKLNLDRRAHVMELFNRAAGQLSHERLEVRLAAVYVLRELARDFPDLANPVFELLQAYLRDGRSDYGDDKPPPDVQAIVDTIRERIKSNVDKTRR
jgi:hypothetical protein